MSLVLRYLTLATFSIATTFASPIAAAQTPSDRGQQPDLRALTLREAERLLLARNRELQAARRTLAATQADAITASARPNPTLALGTTNISPWAGTGPGPLWDKYVDTTVALSQVIERGDKREIRMTTAKALTAAAEQDVGNQLRQSRLALANAYYDLAAAQDKVMISAETMALFDRTIDAAGRRQKAGDIAAADVARIRVDALRAQSDALAVQADRARLQVALAYLIGADAAAAELRAADPWPQASAAVIAPVTDEQLDRRPDVQAAARRIDAAQSGRELARSLRTRDVSVFVQFERWPSPGNTGSEANSVGLGFSVPIFARYHYEGEIARAEADYNSAADGLERVRAQARAELEQARTSVLAAAERLRTYDERLLPEARKSAEYAEFAYTNGAIGVMDLLDARRTLRATQIDAAQVRADYAKALAAWRVGTGEESQ